MQEENGRLQEEKRELMNQKEVVEQDLITLKDQIDEMRQESTGLKEELGALQHEHAGTISKKRILEIENHDLINALAVQPAEQPQLERPSSGPAHETFEQCSPRRSKDFARLSQASFRSRGAPVPDDAEDVERGRDSQADSFNSWMQKASFDRHSLPNGSQPPSHKAGTVGPAQGEECPHGAARDQTQATTTRDQTQATTRARTTPRASEVETGQHQSVRTRETSETGCGGASPGLSRSELDQAPFDTADKPEGWSVPPMWISRQQSQQVHGIATSRDHHTLGDAAVVSWDGSCSLLRASTQDGTLTYQPLWSVFPGKGLYSVAFSSGGGRTGFLGGGR